MKMRDMDSVLEYTTENPSIIHHQTYKMLDWIYKKKKKPTSINLIVVELTDDDELDEAILNVEAFEWELAGEWMWDNKDHYNGLSVLPYDGGTYTQAPFEDCSKETYETMMKSLHNIDLSQVIELDDNTDLSGELACAGGACEIK